MNPHGKRSYSFTVHSQYNKSNLVQNQINTYLDFRKNTVFTVVVLASYHHWDVIFNLYTYQLSKYLATSVITKFQVFWFTPVHRKT